MGFSSYSFQFIYRSKWQDAWSDLNYNVVNGRLCHDQKTVNNKKLFIIMTVMYVLKEQVQKKNKSHFKFNTIWDFPLNHIWIINVVKRLSEEHSVCKYVKNHWPFPRKKNKMKTKSYTKCRELLATSLCQTNDVTMRINMQHSRWIFELPWSFSWYRILLLIFERTYNSATSTQYHMY